MEQKSVEKMGTAPIKKLMLSMGIPVIISRMLQALYNIVDSAFVSNMKDGERIEFPNTGVSCADADGCYRHRYRRRRQCFTR